MNKQERLGQITTEANLREMLVTLFTKMGLAPTHTHGSDEHGRDIVCKEVNSTLGVTEWIGCVVKLGPITGATSGSASLQTIINQVSEAFTHTYADPVTKQKVRMNKVYVITNAEILSTAREKIPEKASAIPNANLYFIDGTALIRLLDSHWQNFWDESEDLFLNDPMSPEVGKTLYVVALAYSNHERRHKQKPSTLSKAEIIKQTGLPETKIESALTFLVRRQYLESSAQDGYTLNSQQTVKRLLRNTSQIRLLFLLDKEANSTRYVSLKRAKKAARKSLGYLPDYVVKTIKTFVRGDYFIVDNSHGKKTHYKMNDGMLQDEDTYLKYWLEYNGKIPQSKSK